MEEGRTGCHEQGRVATQFLLQYDDHSGGNGRCSSRVGHGKARVASQARNRRLGPRKGARSQQGGDEPGGQGAEEPSLVPLFYRGTGERVAAVGSGDSCQWVTLQQKDGAEVVREFSYSTA